MIGNDSNVKDLYDENNILRAYAFEKYAPETKLFLETYLPEIAYTYRNLVDGGKMIFNNYSHMHRCDKTNFIGL